MIQGVNLFLRAIEKEDLEYLWEWENNSETMKYASSNPYSVISKDQLIKNYQNTMKHNFGICLNDGRLVGRASYWVPNRLFSSTVEVGVTIGQHEDRRNGYGLESVMLLLGAIFNQPRIHRVTFYGSDHNYMSKNAHDKYWAKQEGVIRKERFIEGKYYDSLIYGLLRDEYVQALEEYKKQLQLGKK